MEDEQLGRPDADTGLRDEPGDHFGVGEMIEMLQVDPSLDLRVRERDEVPGFRTRQPGRPQLVERQVREPRGGHLAPGELGEAAEDRRRGAHRDLLPDDVECHRGERAAARLVAVRPVERVDLAVHVDETREPRLGGHEFAVVGASPVHAAVPPCAPAVGDAESTDA
ncbi:hypothetical protein GCM10009539_30150 [Cryptosporangium japonicum]|uniref:Uncharacterized protein n=1 Tax=Cryptosporangium japonicum TaxID=80872 RepID=A0ABP3DUI3_9ACTN